jgi:CheY-like chemotaxis protein
MSGQTALIVEDHEDIAEFFAMTLAEVGFTVARVANGQAALNHLAESRPDVVILDLNIPKVSGVEVLHHIRADDRLAGIKVIVASANPHMMGEAYDMADLVLLKPVSYVQFRELVRRLA